jgi:hypothetical protein
MKQRLVFLALALALVAGCGGGSSKAEKPTTTDAPAATEPSTAPTTAAPAALEACKQLVTHEDAESVIGRELADAVVEGEPGDDACWYTADPSGPVGQVEIYVGDGAKSYFDVDAHKTTAVSGIGDEAHYEDYAIFFRKGATWVAIKMVILSENPEFKTRLEDLAKKVVDELP